MRANLLEARRRSFAIVFYSLTALDGARSVLRPSGIGEFRLGLAIATFAAMFCIIDARLRDRPIPWSSYWLFFGCISISAPIYLIWSRGFRSLHWSLLYILGVVAASYAGYYTMIVLIPE